MCFVCKCDCFELLYKMQYCKERKSLKSKPASATEKRSLGCFPHCLLQPPQSCSESKTGSVSDLILKLAEEMVSNHCKKLTPTKLDKCKYKIKKLFKDPLRIPTVKRLYFGTFYTFTVKSIIRIYHSQNVAARLLWMSFPLPWVWAPFILFLVGANC